jgi:thymidylate kinase
MTTREAVVEALAVIAGAARRPVVVFGDLPPPAHDLDVLVDDTDLVAASNALRANGFVGHGHDWVSFRDGDATLVDLFPASSWQLPDDELAALFADAEPMDGLPAGVVRPAAYHRVLLLARRLHWGGPIDERRRRRLDDALAGGEDVVALARKHASAWRLVEPLEALLSGVTEPAVQPGEERRWPWERRRRPVLVALSGIDGSGKSTLAHGLERAFEGLELGVAVAWTRLEWSTLYENRVLAWIAAPVKAVIRLLARGRVAPPAAVDAPGPPEIGDEVAWTRTAPTLADADVARRVRQQSPLLTTVWTAIVAVLQARAQRRAIASAASGDTAVVVCDRSTLDSIVHLRRVYRPDRRLPLASWLLSALSPRPDVALFLDVPPQVALSRKRDVFGPDDLALHAALYVEECGPARVRRVDASGPAGALLDEVARETWLAVASRR